MKTAIDTYGQLAREGAPAIVQAGRHTMQVEAERLVVPDVMAKLAPQPTNTLLEIGCGPGNLLIPLSFLVAHAVGVDHPDIVARARVRFADSRVQFVGGAFPVKFDTTFDRVLVYSVLQTLPDWESVLRFTDAAIELLAPNGRLMFGDIPNVDRRTRFLKSAAGQKFQAEWDSRRSVESDPFSEFDKVRQIGSFTDDMILSLVSRYRARGLNAHVLPQPPELPWGHTREDLLIVRPDVL